MLHTVFREHHVTTMRAKYYELNYFTVSQLLILTRQLSQYFIEYSAMSNGMDTRVFDLLYNVAGPCCDSTKIIKATEGVPEVLQGIQMITLRLIDCTLNLIRNHIF